MWRATLALGAGLVLAGLASGAAAFLDQADSWGAAETVHAPAAGPGAPSAAVMGGAPWVAWEEGPSIVASRLDGDTWSVPETVAAGYAVDLAADGALHAVFVNRIEDQVDVYYASRSGEGWSLPRNVSSTLAVSADPALALFGTRRYVAWRDAGVLYLGRSEDGDAWAVQPVIANGSLVRATSHDLTASAEGPVLVWASTEPTPRIYVSVWNGERWSLPETVSGANGGIWPVTDIRVDGGLAVGWAEHGTNRPAAALGWPGLWGPSEVLDSSAASGPLAAAYRTAGADFAWTSGNGQLRNRYRSGAGWAPVETLTDSAENVTLAEDGGLPWAAWSRPAGDPLGRAILAASKVQDPMVLPTASPTTGATATGTMNPTGTATGPTPTASPGPSETPDPAPTDPTATSATPTATQGPPGTVTTTPGTPLTPGGSGTPGTPPTHTAGTPGSPTPSATRDEATASSTASTRRPPGPLPNVIFAPAVFTSQVAGRHTTGVSAVPPSGASAARQRGWAARSRTTAVSGAPTRSSDPPERANDPLPGLVTDSADAAEELVTLAPGPVWQLDLEVGPGGHPTLVWESDGHVRFASRAETGWLPSEPVALGHAPDGAFDADGSLHVLFVNDFAGVTDVFHSVRSDEGWRLPINASRTRSHSTSPVARFDPVSGELAAAWTEVRRQGPLSHVARWDGRVWHHQPMFQADGYANDLDPGHLAALAWHARGPGRQHFDVYVSFNDGTWSLPENASLSSDRDATGAALGRQAGATHVGWHALADQGSATIRYAARHDAGWSQVDVLGPASETRPVLLLTGHGRSVVWPRTQAVARARAWGSAWRLDELVSAAAGPIQTADATVDRHGDLHVAWATRRNGGGEIRYLRVPACGGCQALVPSAYVPGGADERRTDQGPVTRSPAIE